MQILKKLSCSSDVWEGSSEVLVPYWASICTVPEVKTSCGGELVSATLNTHCWNLTALCDHPGVLLSFTTSLLPLCMLTFSHKLSDFLFLLAASKKSLNKALLFELVLYLA